LQNFIPYVEGCQSRDWGVPRHLPEGMHRDLHPVFVYGRVFVACCCQSAATGQSRLCQALTCPRVIARAGVNAGCGQEVALLSPDRPGRWKGSTWQSCRAAAEKVIPVHHGQRDCACLNIGDPEQYACSNAIDIHSPMDPLLSFRSYEESQEGSPQGSRERPLGFREDLRSASVFLYRQRRARSLHAMSF
jgi:hypothetical protein